MEVPWISGERIGLHYSLSARLPASCAKEPFYPSWGRRGVEPEPRRVAALEFRRGVLQKSWAEELFLFEI